LLKHYSKSIYKTIPSVSSSVVVLSLSLSLFDCAVCVHDLKHVTHLKPCPWSKFNLKFYTLITVWWIATIPIILFMAYI